MKQTYDEMRKAQMDVQEKWFDEWNKTGSRPTWSYEDARDAIYTEWLMSMEVGDHAHICHYSDVTPCTVIKKTATTITVRHDKARKSDKWNPQWEVGGFSAICTNNENQDGWWIIEEDPDGYTEVFRYRKSSGRYMNKSDERLYPDWRYYYDYNF